MAHYTYYCEMRIKQENIEPGIYKIDAVEHPATRWFSKLQGLLRMSERVWKQGPRGGVKIVKAPWSDLWPTGYITTNEKYMKEFAWIKLRAKSL
jgi:hypothetical protein